MRALLIVLATLIGLAFAASTAQALDSRLQVHFDTDEADAAIRILEIQRDGNAPSEADWQRLFETDGYRRLKEREASLDRHFDDDEFQAFLTDPETVSRAPALRAALDEWSGIDPQAAGEKAFAYLSNNAVIQATVYIAVKPQTNSFVFELDSDPAIFLYLNPTRSAAVTEVVITHELHHVGVASTCPPAAIRSRRETAPPHRRTLHKWLGAYDEGLAMLAAAGGVDVHPHKYSSPESRARWDRDMANVPTDLAEQNAFFRAVFFGEMTDVDSIEDKAFTYFGIQGPWYTVGWHMAATIERAFGRDVLLKTMCEQDTTLQTYNRAARLLAGETGVALPTWDQDLADGLASGALQE